MWTRPWGLTTTSAPSITSSSSCPVTVHSITTRPVVGWTSLGLWSATAWWTVHPGLDPVRTNTWPLLHRRLRRRAGAGAGLGPSPAAVAATEAPGSQQARTAPRSREDRRLTGAGGLRRGVAQW